MTDHPARWGRAELQRVGAPWRPGATLGGLPDAPGWHRLEHTRTFPAARFEPARDALHSWQVHRRAGLAVRPNHPRVGVGVFAVLWLGPVPAPVQVVATVDEPDRSGFAYVAVHDHPEQGEEAFLLERSGDVVHAVVRAVSRPATRWLSAAGPVGVLAQHVAARRYLAAMARSGRG
ncbi:DUF1990 domain-containing protein [Desertihabitans brevis]|uniref:DUF1990 domain-containing protein n=2 Tax=Desertihabitans brevis TaxID=2268447 RepID=A0A367Z100_9ACTN|nr:DUF1990 domain-containing protein [Desertihabitans brevis]